MKVSHAVVAALALSAGAAQAQGIEHLTGASATRNNMVLALNSMCSSGFVLFKDASGTSNPGNIFTAKCNGGNFASPTITTSVNEVRVNVNGGSLLAVTGSFNGTIQRPFIDASNPPAACAAAAAGSGVLGPISAIRVNCGATTGLFTAQSLGGYMDVEGPIFLANGTLPAATPGLASTNFKPSTFNQGFGVAVSKRLYEALQEFQTAEGRLPAICTTVSGVVHTASGLTTPECQPSISKADYAALAATGNNLAKGNGANWLIGGTGAVNGVGGTAIKAGVVINSPLGAAPNKRIFLCRRPNSSGTQAASQIYFLNRPTGTTVAVGGQLLHGGNGNDVPSGTAFVDQAQNNSNMTFRTNSGSSDAVNCVNGNPASDANPVAATDPLAYAIGTLSLENNPLATSPVGNYRFIKVQNQHASEGTGTASQTTESIAGRYDYWFNAIKYCPNGASGGTCATTLDAIDSAVVTGAGSPGIFRLTETNYTRGARSTNPIVTK